MSEKKVVSRTTAIALGVLCIILLIGTVGAVIYFNNMVTEKNNEFTALQSSNSAYVNSHSHANTDYESLKREYDSYVASHSSTSNDYERVVSELSSANSQITSLKAAKVVNVGMTVTANDPVFGDSYLRVSGYVCNVGSNTASNVKLHVVGSRNAVLVIDTYISIGTISGESWKQLSTTDLPHAGGALTSWTITPEWA
jgi:hypothetical protein